MTLIDANVLLYAVDSSARHHANAKSWLDAALSGVETVAIPWICLLAFLRISTHTSIYASPLTLSQAGDVVRAWLARPCVVVPDPTPRHAEVLLALLEATGHGGNLVNDAHLASLALEHGATVVTFDHDFLRFAGVECHVLPDA